MKILAIETSCDETAAAVIEKSGPNVCILSNIVASQIKIHKKYGGVFPEYASRAHTEKIIPVVEEALITAGISLSDLIAVTTGPGLIGSLLVGVNFAKTLAFTTRKPIIGINHWLGHIYSNFVRVECKNQKSKIKNYKKRLLIASSEAKSGSQAPQEGAAAIVPVERPSFCDERATIPQFPSLILIVSGGHTGLVLMKSHTNIQTLGATLDDAAGEAFDKVAKMLHLDYPGGPAIAKAASKFSNLKFKISNEIQNSNFKIDSKFKIKNLKFPRSMLNSGDYNFSFSGLKTAVLYKVQELAKRYPLNAIRSQVAYEFQQAVIDILIGKTIQAAYEFQPKSICLCGGVAANQELRQQLKLAVEKLPSKTSYHIPPMELATDNAAMVGIAAAYQSPKQYTTYDKINAEANSRL